jgi:AraC-like DNA-binding protein
MQSPFVIHEITAQSNGVFMASGPNTPHCHDHHQVLIITRGGGVHDIDGETHDVAPPWGMLVAKGKVHLFMPHPEATGWCLDFTEEFLPPETTWLFSPFFELSNVSLARPLLLDQVTSLARLLQAGSAAGEAGARPALPHLLAALLQVLQCEIQDLATRNRPHRAGDFAIFCQFMRQLEEAFLTQKEVGFYTRQMRITSKRLAAVCRASLGKTPQAIILERCMTEAKRRLLHSGDSVQQLGFALGYEDPSHFTKTFRKITGETPSHFRKTRLRIDINF